MRLSLLSLALAAAGASASLEVRLSHLDGTKIRASVTNSGEKAYNVLLRGSIFDPDPVRKLDVENDTSTAPFHGMSKQTCSHMSLSQDDFAAIAVGQTIDHDLDIAELYDLDVDTYYVSSKKSVPYAEEGSIELTGDVLPVSGNQLQLTLNEKKPAGHMGLKRTTIQSDCSSSQRSAVETANQACAKMANAAADAAESGSDSAFEEFFKDNSESTRSQVASSYRKVADECSSTPGGTGKSLCTDQQNNCGGDLLAYTYWQNQGSEHVGTTYYCPRYFNGQILAASSTRCGEQSRGSNTLHETTHAVLATQDIAYGLSSVKSLSSSQALQNADTYTFYAISVDLDCSSSGSTGGSNSGSSNGGFSAPSNGGSTSNTQRSNTGNGRLWWA